MNGESLKTKRLPSVFLLASAIGLIWGTIIGWLWLPYAEPLTGFGRRGLLLLTLFHFGLAAAITLLFAMHWKLLGSLLVILVLFVAPPLPSKRGIDLRITNSETAPIRVLIQRVDRPSRKIVLEAAPGETLTYRTAPGDYREDTEDQQYPSRDRRDSAALESLRTSRRSVQNSGRAGRHRSGRYRVISLTREFGTATKH
jgi:hypothetical protein